MKHTVTAVLTAFALLQASAVQAQFNGNPWLPKGLNPKEYFKKVTRCPTSPDPSFVNGYMAFEDPVTGEPWVPTREERGIQVAGHAIGFDVHFRSRSNPDETMFIPARTGVGIMNGWAGGIIYVVRLRPDRNAGRPSAPFQGNLLNITYNPDQWCFDKISIDPISNIRGFENLRQRQQNFPTLPDLPVCRPDNLCFDR